jgi:protocatechuate 3,4-dioxygenase beta subunit
MRNLVVALFALLATSAYAREPIVGLPCEGCEAVFDGLPAHLAPRSRIAPQSEPGQPMTVTGRVLGTDGKPRPGVIVYAYQTNARGIYPPPSNARDRASDRHGLLRGWAVAGPDGRYAFETIRPGSYPSRDVPAHIHMHVIEPRCATYYIDDIMFTDDPLLTKEEARRHNVGRGGTGIVAPTLPNGRWLVTRDIRLGFNIPGYPKCSRKP